MLVSMLLLAKAVQWLAGELVGNFTSPFNHLESYTYLVPLGAGAILVALLANGRIAIVYTAFGAILFGAINGLAGHDMNANALLARASTSAQST